MLPLTAEELQSIVGEPVVGEAERGAGALLPSFTDIFVMCVMDHCCTSCPVDRDDLTT
jgi:hypothetical protein